jgi:hypothetical protein
MGLGSELIFPREMMMAGIRLSFSSKSEKVVASPCQFRYPAKNKIDLIKGRCEEVQLIKRKSGHKAIK